MPVPPQPASFGIIPWVNGRDDTALSVTAWIGGTLCATGVPFFPPTDPSPTRSRAIFQLTVPAEEVLPGCGREGAIVTFFVDGQRAPQTAVWHANAFRGAFQGLNLIIGPPFARFIVNPSGEVVEPSGPVRRFVPYIGDKACGYAGVVYSNEQEPGCGVEGSQITFKALDAQGNVIAVANEKATWHAWDGVSDVQHLDLTFGPAGGITVPNTGTGDGPGSGGNPWLRLSIGLALAGLASGICGLALRRRTANR